MTEDIPNYGSVEPQDASETEPARLSRREALALVAAAAGTLGALDERVFAAAPGPAQPYGLDPALNKTYAPGDFWPLTLTAEQRLTVRTLADLILPADGPSPAASEVGVVEFIDEWISAPYELQRADRTQILAGLTWLDSEAIRRFSRTFGQLSLTEQTAIADDLAFPATSRPEFKNAAAFFARFRNLAAGGYYASRRGLKDIGFVGNVPLVRFDGPPAKIRAQLGV